ncbi:hypothetical protein [Nocardia brasiliensis]|uniref:hypothetical protein n=1 Tax=Nocardia brasiliensis TaxID=37326 RepID=UPI00030DE897|nr:hypothetical protein [Nocardia brasiliensis]OCF87696.1 hypothetical protein AW168_24740 [Nocardia brasiliensis]
MQSAVRRNRIEDTVGAYRALLDTGRDPATIVFAGTLDEADEALDRAALFLAQHIRAGQR